MTSDLTFLLSADPVPETFLEALRENGGVLFSDGLGEHESCDTRAVHSDLRIETGVRLHRRSPPDAGQRGARLWTDGFGRPLLEVSAEGRGSWYRLHGRLHPLWSDLPLDPTFPEWLASLVEERAHGGLLRSAATPRSDLRGADPSQRQPAVVAAGAAGTPRIDTAPEHWLWFAVLILFGFERFLATRSRTR